MTQAHEDSFFKRHQEKSRELLQQGAEGKEAHNQAVKSRMQKIAFKVRALKLTPGFYAEYGLPSGKNKISEDMLNFGKYEYVDDNESLNKLEQLLALANRLRRNYETSVDALINEDTDGLGGDEMYQASPEIEYQLENIHYVNNFTTALINLYDHGQLQNKGMLKNFFDLALEHADEMNMVADAYLQDSNNLKKLKEEKADDEARRIYYVMMSGYPQKNDEAYCDEIRERPDILKIMSNDFGNLAPAKVFALLEKSADLYQEIEQKSPLPGFSEQTQNLMADIKQAVMEAIPLPEKREGMSDAEHKKQMADFFAPEIKHLRELSKKARGEVDFTEHSLDTITTLGRIWGYKIERNIGMDGA